MGPAVPTTMTEKWKTKKGKRQIKVVATGHQAGIRADRNCNFS